MRLTDWDSNRLPSSASNSRRHSSNSFSASVKKTETHLDTPSVSSSEQLLDSARELSGLGYQEELKREFNLFSAFSFAVSISGVFATIGTTLYYPLSSGGAAAIVWAWALGGVGCLCIAFSVAEIVSAYPTSGGLYYACSRVFPPEWSPAMCWLDGWVNLLGQIAGVASSDFGAAQMLLAAVSMGSDYRYVPTNGHVVGVMAAVLTFHGFVNSFPTKYLERLTSSYVVFHFGCLLAGVIALLVKTEPKHDAGYVFSHVESSTGWSPVGFSFMFGCLSVSWTMTDYDAAAHISEEMKRPNVIAPWAICLAMIFTYVVGFLYNIVLTFCMGDPQYIMNQTQPVAAIYYQALGKGGGIFFTVAMFVVMNMVGISSLQACSRTMWSQSRDAMIPYFGKKWLYRVNKRTKTPVNCVWVCTLLCIAINLIALGSSTAINAIFNVCAIALDWSYITPIIGKMLFKDLFKPGPWSLGKFSVIVNGWAVLWTLFISVVFFLPTELPVTATNMNYAVVFFVGIVSLSITFWHLGGRRVYRGPQASAPDPAVAAEIDMRGEVKDEKRE